MKAMLQMLWLLSLGVMAREPIYDPIHDKVPFYTCATFADAGHDDLELHEVMQSASLKFMPLESDNQGVGFTSHYFWVRFQLKTPQ